jgi:hypothetical protein
VLGAAVLLTAVLLAGGLVSNSKVAMAAVTGTPIYWGRFTTSAPYDTSELGAFEAAVGKGQSIVHWGQGWISGGKFLTFQTKYFDAVRARGSIPMLSWGSWDTSKGKNQSDFRLATIASGKYDSFIRQWATAAKAWGHPFFLRFDHEMNGDWQFPWAEKANGNHPGDFVHAWRRVHQIFDSVGATNVTWVWCPNISESTTVALSTDYPGDTWVDWTCLDGYNPGASQGARWLTFGQVFGGGLPGLHNSYAEIMALAPDKPLMIGETASSEKGGSKAKWISSALVDELPQQFAGVQGLVWFNWNAGDSTRDWPIETSDSARAAFSSAVASSLYAGADFGNLSISPIPIASRAGATPAAQPAAPAQPDQPAQPAPPQADPRYFADTHFRVDDDTIWGYFQARGGLDVFGFPVSRTFTFRGCRSQIFQREVAQVCSDGSPRLLNLLDPDIFPYTQVNGSTLPASDDDLKAMTPTVDAPDYATSMLDFVRAEATDTFAGQPVDFGRTFFGLITPDVAGVDGPLLDLLNLEVWGAPISEPMIDPNNGNFIYQRFQRGIMHYDAGTGVTRGLLLADYLKAVLTGQNLPDDLAQQAEGGPLYHQYCPGQPLSLCRPDELTATDLSGAFETQ